MYADEGNFVYSGKHLLLTLNFINKMYSVFKFKPQNWREF
jgi:hypothetical protein